MNDREPKQLWRRLVVEGPVIVISILLAFAIDAWWDDRQAERIALDQLRSVATELEANERRVAEKIATLNQAIEATTQIMSWMGPQPTAASVDAFHDQYTRTLSIGFFTLQRSAISDALAAGLVGSRELASLRRTLSDWISYGDELENQYELLRVEHAKLIDYMQETVAVWHFGARHPLMAGLPSSKFPIDLEALLSDQRIESLLSIYLIRLKFVIDEAHQFLSTQADVQSRISAVVDPAE